MKKKIVTIVTPCFNEADNIIPLYKQVTAVFSRLKKYDFELIYVDNASVDQSETILTRLTRKDKRVRAIIMSRNFRSPQPSMLAGLQIARGEAVVILHGDIQDPPELIADFIHHWEKGYQVVYGVRKKRKGYGTLMNFFYRAFYYILKKLSYIDIPLDAGEFSLMDRRVVRELLSFDEYDYYVRCIRAYVGFRQIGIEYIRDARTRGRSTESFFSGLWWAKTMIVNFSLKPLELIAKIAFVVMLCSFIFIVINFFLYFFPGLPHPEGVPTIVILILFLGGIQLLSLSIIAEYLAKIFLEVKHRPRFIIKKKINVQT